MKKVLVITALFCLISSSTMARIFVDTSFMYGRTWTTMEDAGPSMSTEEMTQNMYGFTWGFGFYFNREFNVKIEGMYLLSKGDDLFYGMKDLSATAYSFNVEFQFVPHIPAMNKHRLQWINSLFIGYLGAEAEIEDLMSSHTEEDSGLYISITTGLLIEASQYVAPFFSFGYARMMYLDKWDNQANNLFVLRAGIRLNIIPPKKLFDTY